MARSYTPLDRIRERSARPSASQKGIRKNPDVALLANLAVYENQGGGASAAAPGAPAPGPPALEGPGAGAHAGPAS